MNIILTTNRNTIKEVFGDSKTFVKRVEVEDVLDAIKTSESSQGRLKKYEIKFDNGFRSLYKADPIVLSVLSNIDFFTEVSFRFHCKKSSIPSATAKDLVIYYDIDRNRFYAVQKVTNWCVEYFSYDGEIVEPSDNIFNCTYRSAINRSGGYCCDIIVISEVR